MRTSENRQLAKFAEFTSVLKNAALGFRDVG
jgi:hypothetical protein